MVYNIGFNYTISQLCACIRTANKKFEKMRIVLILSILVVSVMCRSRHHTSYYNCLKSNDPTELDNCATIKYNNNEISEEVYEKYARKALDLLAERANAIRRKLPASAIPYGESQCLIPVDKPKGHHLHLSNEGSHENWEDIGGSSEGGSNEPDWESNEHRVLLPGSRLNQEGSVPDGTSEDESGIPDGGSKEEGSVPDWTSEDKNVKHDHDHDDSKSDWESDDLNTSNNDRSVDGMNDHMHNGGQNCQCPIHKNRQPDHVKSQEDISGPNGEPEDKSVIPEHDNGSIDENSIPDGEPGEPNMSQNERSEEKPTISDSNSGDEDFFPNPGPEDDSSNGSEGGNSNQNIENGENQTNTLGNRRKSHFVILIKHHYHHLG